MQWREKTPAMLPRPQDALFVLLTVLRRIFNRPRLSEDRVGHAGDQARTDSKQKNDASDPDTIDSLSNLLGHP
ncbi:hypothetical protein E5D57_003365 [Metarhizium anisopliae]|nr:hypothetical protein E5D57_003365 [Metarhizium anisopliae]